MESSLVLGLTGLFSTLISLGLEIALLVIALGPVQKHRPEATMPLVGSAGMSLFVTLIWYPATTIGARSFDPADYRTVMALLSLFNAGLHGISGFLLIVAILRLVSPRNTDPTRYT